MRLCCSPLLPGLRFKLVTGNVLSGPRISRLAMGANGWATRPPEAGIRLGLSVVQLSLSRLLKLLDPIRQIDFFIGWLDVDHGGHSLDYVLQRHPSRVN